MIGFNKSSASVTNSSVTFDSGTRDLPRQSQTATNQPNGGIQTQQIRGSSGLGRDSRCLDLMQPCCLFGVIFRPSRIWKGDIELAKTTRNDFKGHTVPLILMCMTLGAAACGGTVAFQGQKSLVVTGSSPAPPVASAALAAPARQRVAVHANKIEIDEKIQFEHDKATILEASYGLLNEVTDVIKNNPQIKKILIEGHASSEGDAAYNLKLSDERAKAVMKYLEDHGIAKARLSSKGFGSKEPIADNKTEEGREKNRRVEFTIVDPPTSGGAK